MKNFILALIPLFIASCASVGAVIEGGKDLTTSVIDSTVKTAGNMTNAVLDDVSSVVDTVGDSVGDVVDTVVEEVDSQTNELQNEEDNQEK